MPMPVGYRLVRIVRNETGSALVVSLFLLLIMTLLGITAMQTSTLEERMSANLGDMDQAFQRAERGLRSAEDLINAETDFVGKYHGSITDDDAMRIEAGIVGFAADCSNGRCYATAGVAQTVKLTALTTNGNYYSVNVGGSEIARYLVEFSCQDTLAGNCAYVFTITSRGLGDDGNTQVTLEEVYRTE